MSFDRRKVRDFFRAWKARFLDRMFGLLNLAGVLASLLGFFGLTVAGNAYAMWLLGSLVVLVAFSAARSLPRFHLHPSDLAGQRIEIEELDRLLTPITTVGLIGISEVGKSTFLNAVRHRRDPKRVTEKPYSVVILLPDETPSKYIAIIDSVGQRDENQFHILRMSTVACVFLDHNKTNTDTRLQRQTHFVSQIATAKKASVEGADKIIVIANKADLWTHDPVGERRMKVFIRKCIQELEDSRFSEVIQIDAFSNFNSDDVSRLMIEIKNAISS